MESTDKRLQTDFQTFIFKNEVIYAAAGISIGVATKEAIQGIITQLILPFLSIIGHKILAMKMFKHSVNHILVTNFLSHIGTIIWILLVYCLSIYLTYVILERFVNREIIGLKTAIVNPQEAKTMDELKVKKTDKLLEPLR